MAKSFFEKIMAKLKRQNKKMPLGIKMIVCWYAAFVAISFTAYFCLCLLLIWGGAAKLADILAMIKELVSVQAIGAVFAVAKFFIDTDGDGLPDTLEKDNNKRM